MRKARWIFGAGALWFAFASWHFFLRRQIWVGGIAFLVAAVLFARGALRRV